MTSINPTQLPVWNELQRHADELRSAQLQEMFHQDPKRFDKFSIDFMGKIFLDYSKNLINEESMKLLIKLAHDCSLSESINRLFLNNELNQTEKKAVLHTALRDQTLNCIEVNGIDIVPQIKSTLEHMEKFSNQVFEGHWKGYTGKSITDVVNIGIGGSDLGPKMIIEALRDYKSPHINIHFVSNADGADIAEIFKKIKPETTLFLVASKTFTTQETLLNANTAKKWFLSTALDEKHISKHFVAMSTNQQAVLNFGITEANRFEFWDWVGGRYSWCSAIGLSVACSIGFNNFEKILSGAHQMDQHFKKSSFDKNIPVVLALIGIWYRNFFNTSTEAVLPYDQRLNSLVPYLQQTNMESNGKSIDRSGAEINYQTGPVIWGGVGTNGQHSFYQLIHQGTQIIPCDFLVSLQPHHNLTEHHSVLLSHFFAQTAAMAFGNKSDADGPRDSHRLLKGNHPSNSIVFKKLEPQTLGSLISMYEHKVFVQGIVWNIFSFDQWGVEWGKKLANKILPKLDEKSSVTDFDSSTNGLINYYKNNLN